MNRPYASLSPALGPWAPSGPRGPSTTTRLLVKLQRRFANGLRFLTAYTYGKTIDLASDNDGLVTLTNVYDPGLQPGAGRLRRDPHAQLELDL